VLFIVTKIARARVSHTPRNPFNLDDVVDARDAILVQGFVDCHIHYPGSHA
jgi:N-acyl-D-aspartate/D-glutamate deacylase